MLLRLQGLKLLSLASVVVLSVGCGTRFSNSQQSARAASPLETGVDEIRPLFVTRLKDSTADRSSATIDNVTVCQLDSKATLSIEKHVELNADKKHARIWLKKKSGECKLETGYIFVAHFDEASRSLLESLSKASDGTPSDTHPNVGTVDEYLQNFRNEFTKTKYGLGMRGPQFYDCSTSIVYMFVKMKLIAKGSGTLSVDEYRNRQSSYDPAYMDLDKTNFVTLSKQEKLKKGDIVLMGLHCSKPTHWAIISDIDVKGKGEEQANWRVNKIMEVKGGAKAFDEGWNQLKFRDNTLCKAIRHKAFHK